MGDHGRPGRPPAAEAAASVPAMPVIDAYQPRHDSPLLLIDDGDVRHSIGWQRSPDKEGGPGFVVVRLGALGTIKTLERFPLTEDGWAGAWRALARRDAESARQVFARIEERTAASDVVAGRQLDADYLAYLPAVIFLGGYAQGRELDVGKPYDVRFLESRLAVLPSGRTDALIEVPYSEIEAVDIGGPGLVKSGGGFVGGGFGVTGAVEGLAIAAVLNAMTTRTKVKTVVRIQGTGCELFLLNMKTEPEALRIKLSRSLGAIREAQATRAGTQRHDASRPASLVRELGKLASMLENGLLTREEFELLKTRLITES